MIATGVLSRQLIGRSRELAFLAERSRATTSGARFVVVRGEAGIGKTRLLAEFASAARAEGKRVAIGTAREFANGPYDQFSEALLAMGAQTPHRAAEVGEEGKTTWYAAVADTLRAAVSATPSGAILVLEDIHWADAATIDLLRFVRSRLADAPLLFVCTYRSDELTSDTARALAISALERDSDVVVLQPLAPGQIEHLIARVLQGIGRRIAPDVVAEIRDLSDGRPFFAEELLRGVLDRLQRDERAVPTVPTSIRATVHERYASLSSAAREILLHAAVFGRNFSAALVAELLGVELRLVYSSLRHARDLQLIVEDEGDDDGDRFAFRHALTREAVYGEMLRAEARIVHGRVADLLAGRPNARAAEIAEHAWRARSGEDAALWNERAADEAYALYAYADAARLYERAFRSSSEQERQLHVSERAADACYAIGDLDSSAEWYAHAAEANMKLQRQTYAGRLRLRRARILLESGRYDEGFVEAARLAVDDDSIEAALTFEAKSMTAGFLAYLGRPLEALECLESAQRVPVELDPSIAIHFSSTYAYVCALLRKPDEARCHFAETLQHAQSLNDPDMILRTYNNWGCLEASYGTIQRASELYSAAFSIAGETKRLRQTAWLGQNAALAALLSGNLDAADDFLKKSSEIGHGLSSVHLWSTALKVRLSTLRAIDDNELFSQALCLFENSCATADLHSVHVLGASLALHFASLGADGDACRITAMAARDLERADAPYWILDIVSRIGDTALRDRARDALSQISSRTDAWPARGFAALTDAREARRNRDRESASHLATIAVDAFGQAGWHLEEAFGLEVAGRIGEAIARFRTMGAIAEVRRLTEISTAPRRRGDFTLTGREREIARLVAAGKTARAISETLVISERTVESHLAAAYRKLGVSGRAALAALLEDTET